MPSTVETHPSTGVETSHVAHLVAPGGPAGVLACPGGAPHVNPAVLYMASLTTAQSRDTAVACMRRLLTLLQQPGTEELVADWWDFAWERIGPEQTTFLRNLLVLRFAPSTARMGVSVLRSILKQCWRQRLMSAETYQRAIDLPKIPGGDVLAGRMLEPAEVQQLIAYIDGLPKPYGTMIAALFAVGMGGGLRREELGTLPLDALTHEGKLRFLGKGRRVREQAIATWARARVDAWLVARAQVKGLESVKTLFVWTSRGLFVARPLTLWKVNDLISDTGKAAGLRSFSPHDLRRTFASNMLDASDLSMTRTAMGHRSPTTTMRYDRRDVKRVVDAVEKLEGFGFEKVEDGARVDPIMRKTIDVPRKGLTTLGAAAKAKGPQLTKQKAASSTMPDAADSPNLPGQGKKIVLDGQELVQRGRVLRPPQFRRNGAPLDLVWAHAQCLNLAKAGKSHDVIRSALQKVGVCRADGTELEVGDVTKLL